MSNVKREWNPCKLCKQYYDEKCDNVVKHECKFIPVNDFSQFLFTHNFQLNYKTYEYKPFIYLIERDSKYLTDITIREGYKAKLIDPQKENAIYILKENDDFKTVFFIYNDEDIRDKIYNNYFIMTTYSIGMLLPKDIIKENIESRIDGRFRKIYV